MRRVARKELPQGMDSARRIEAGAEQHCVARANVDRYAEPVNH